MNKETYGLIDCSQNGAEDPNDVKETLKTCHVSKCNLPEGLFYTTSKAIAEALEGTTASKFVLLCDNPYVLLELIRCFVLADIDTIFDLKEEWMFGSIPAVQMCDKLRGDYGAEIINRLTSI